MIYSIKVSDLSKFYSEEEKIENRKKLEEFIKSYKDLEQSMKDKGLDTSILRNMVC